MLIMRRMAIARYTKPLIFSKILNFDPSFINMLESLEAEDILLLKDELGSVFYYLIMSLYDVSGIQNDSSGAIRERLKRVLLDAIEQSNSDQSGAVGSQVSEIREIRDRLRSAYQSISNRVCRTLISALGNETLQEETDSNITQQSNLQRRLQMFQYVIQAVEILADKLNTAVVEGKVSPEQVSEYLSCTNESHDSIAPDTMSALVKLYSLTDDPQLTDLAYSLVKTFLMKFGRYKLDGQGRNSMHYAVNMCSPERQESFLCEMIQPSIYERVSIVNEVDASRNNLMHYAACAPYMNYQILKYLVKNFPAMMTQQNCYGDTPLHIMSYVYFVNFAKILSSYNITYRENMNALKEVVDRGLPLSQMRERVMSIRRNDEALSRQLKAYVDESVGTYQLLLTMVPLRQIFEVRNNAGHTVYDIMNASMSNIGNERLESLLQDFSQASSRLPIYDCRIDSQHELCVNLCFSNKYRVVGKSGYGHVLYTHVKRMYDLISYKFSEISDSRMRCIKIENERGNNRYLSMLVVMMLMALCVLNTVLHFKTRSILGIEQGLYRSVLFSAISVVFFVSICVFCIVYAKYVDVADKKLIIEEEGYARSILLSHLDVQETDTSQRRREG
ncbi:hypothetical protein ECHHL_0977 [Ehrlichia chaffeensis str. Heartland]|uniref:ankyrin repeat domain-containing protein n=1 Tax=Ehrlichia chaffeensis TaxID=945 RepID=UPI000053DA53|nr:ankyrin repeat domain-containing protein [Ehrlichia chaffeensis]AHX04103.1 hypothetical protein ECHHL_0977 [Ehrlichia chaffeensis str. Heartland]AHX10659.1 hypothetical protein ECHWP_0972 [Ehrlichia chaffeensis str. West Paces]